MDRFAFMVNLFLNYSHIFVIRRQIKTIQLSHFILVYISQKKKTSCITKPMAAGTFYNKQSKTDEYFLFRNLSYL